MKRKYRLRADSTVEVEAKKELLYSMCADGITEIRNEMFMGCSSIDRIVIPEHVEQIGEDAFGECRNLIIKGYPNSIAEKYAIEHNIPFESI